MNMKKIQKYDHTTLLRVGSATILFFACDTTEISFFQLVSIYLEMVKLLRGGGEN